MPEPAKEKWWTDVVSVDSVELEDFEGEDKDIHLLWGDRVRVLDTDGGRSRVSARGATGWVPTDALGGEPLLELYFIDVGQGDGVLVVTPEGHNLMIDGGHQRSRQQTGKSAADFVDWKFHKDYLDADERDDPAKNVIRLDVLIASHPDADHYGGLRDLIDRDIESKADELDSDSVTVEAFYHPGLCPQVGGTDDLGAKDGDTLVQLLGDRASAVAGLSANPGDAPKLRGWWKDFIEAVVDQTTKSGDPTPFVRLSDQTGHLPGFEPNGSSAVAIKVLAPIERDVGGKPGLKDLGDEGVNKNGHSIALHLTYRDRTFLLTGDLNDQSQADIIEAYGDQFVGEWRVDVAKACHHGSHHQDFDFLRGVGALSTVFSSGDANTYDHPRAWVLGGAALAGRVIKDPNKHRLIAPLIYSTEVARSIALKGLEQLREFSERQSYGRQQDDPIRQISGAVTTSKWRSVLDRDSSAPRDVPPVPDTRAMRQIIYGLVNVRSDGERLLFAVRNEGNRRWAYETIEAAAIQNAVQPTLSSG